MNVNARHANGATRDGTREVPPKTLSDDAAREGEQQEEPHDIREHSRYDQQDSPYDDECSTEEAFFRDASERQHVLPLLNDAASLAAGERGTKHSGGDDEQHGGKQAEPPADPEQQVEFDDRDQREKKEELAHGRPYNAS